MTSDNQRMLSEAVSQMAPGRTTLYEVTLYLDIWCCKPFFVNNHRGQQDTADFKFNEILNMRWWHRGLRTNYTKSITRQVSIINAITLISYIIDANIPSHSVKYPRWQKAWHFPRKGWPLCAPTLMLHHVSFSCFFIKENISTLLFSIDWSYKVNKRALFITISLISRTLTQTASSRTTRNSSASYWTRNIGLPTIYLRMEEQQWILRIAFLWWAQYVGL